MTETTGRIIDVIRAIPRGKVAGYGQIARAAGMPNGARQVVRVLHACAERDGLPWHRVLKADGSIALGPGAGRELQTSLLEAEGVEVDAAGRVDLARYGWDAGTVGAPPQAIGPRRRGPKPEKPERPSRSAKPSGKNGASTRK